MAGLRPRSFYGQGCHNLAAPELSGGLRVPEDWTQDQEEILAHDIEKDGRVLAGPGTGKSTTILALGEVLQAQTAAEGAVQVITFTRAATSELTLKALEGDHAFAPRTLHSYALSLLMRNPGLAGLPEPLRIPDKWEGKLIHSDIMERLRARGFNVRVKTVERLEREMAAQWESLTPDLVLLADLNPELRNAYLAVWAAHRAVYGYSLHAEMPLYAKEILEDHAGIDLGDLEFLIVDEYQDLNRCEIGMLQALSARAVRILGVGDDDQSIYGFRMADPSGIVQFRQHFTDAADYSMTISHRCGKNILDAARIVIESAPNRAPKPPLKPGDENPDGIFEYLRFDTQDEECRGVARLVEHLVNTHGVDPSDIVGMMRADFNGQWSRPVRSNLKELGIPSTDVEQAVAPLSEAASRLALAVARLAVNREDDLAWWTVLALTSGISTDFIRVVADEALARHQRFSSRLFEIDDDPPEEVTTSSLTRARDTVSSFVQFLQGIDTEGVTASENGWADWLIETATDLGIEISDEFASLAISVGRVTPQEEGIAHFLNQLEPVTADLALETSGVSIMSMNRSKGLTRRAAIVMGVEQGVIPFPLNDDKEEERRLLYVAMTRPREFLSLTMAQRRTGPPARTGTPNSGERSRSEFFRYTPIQPSSGADYLEQIPD